MKFLFSIFLILFLFACERGGVVEYNQYLNHNDTVKYVGKEQCKNCHVDIYNSYIQTYLQRDVRALTNVGNEIKFHRFLKAAAARTGQLINYADFASKSICCECTNDS